MLLGASLQVDSTGWWPVAGVLGYRRTSPVAPESTETRYALKPSRGLRHQRPAGTVHSADGFLFISHDLGGGSGARGGG